MWINFKSRKLNLNFQLCVVNSLHLTTQSATRSISNSSLDVVALSIPHHRRTASQLPRESTKANLDPGAKANLTSPTCCSWCNWNLALSLPGPFYSRRRKYSSGGNIFSGCFSLPPCQMAFLFLHRVTYCIFTWEGMRWSIHFQFKLQTSHGQQFAVSPSLSPLHHSGNKRATRKQQAIEMCSITGTQMILRTHKCLSHCWWTFQLGCLSVREGEYNCTRVVQGVSFESNKWIKGESFGAFELCLVSCVSEKDSFVQCHWNCSGPFEQWPKEEKRKREGERGSKDFSFRFDWPDLARTTIIITKCHQLQWQCNESPSAWANILKDNNWRQAKRRIGEERGVQRERERSKLATLLSDLARLELLLVFFQPTIPLKRCSLPRGICLSRPTQKGKNGKGKTAL